MSPALLLVLTLAAFVMASFFAGSETGIIASDRIRLRHLADKGDKRAKEVLRYIENPEHFLSVVLVGTNLGVIGSTATFTALMVIYFGDAAASVASLILVPTLLVFEEIIPKGLFLHYPTRASLASIYWLRFFATILYPVIVAFSATTHFLLAVFRVKRMGRRLGMTMEELLFHLGDSTSAGLISKDTMQLASRAVHLRNLKARDVMTPLENVVMVEEGLGVDDYRRIVASERFTRFPVYRGARQDVVGFLSIHNLLAADAPQSEGLVLEPPYLVRSDSPIVEMLIRMKNHGCHMAMVQDKSGKTIGMTTLEDILERLVGAIEDEFH